MPVNFFKFESSGECFSDLSKYLEYQVGPIKLTIYSENRLDGDKTATLYKHFLDLHVFGIHWMGVRWRTGIYADNNKCQGKFYVYNIFSNLKEKLSFFIRLYVLKPFLVWKYKLKNKI